MSRKKHLADPHNIIQGFAKNHDQIVSEIQAQVAIVVEIATKYHPLNLLMLCHHHFLNTLDGRLRESEMGSKEIIAMRLPEYVQSIIVSNPQAGTEIVSIQNFSKLIEAVTEVYELLMLPHLLAEEGKRHQEKNRGRNHQDQVIAQHRMRWLAVRSDRHIKHDFQFLREFLVNHSPAVERVFGLTSEEIVIGLEKLYDVYVNGVNALIDEERTLNTDWDRRVEQFLIETNTPTIPENIADGSYPPEIAERMRQLFIEEKFDEKQRDIHKRHFDGDLHDILAITEWPERFLDALALSPGEDCEFMVGDQAGWPIRLLPNMQKPFLKWMGRFYFFEITTLFDYIYHNIRAAVTAGSTKLDQDWGEQQGIDTEKATHAALADLLPDALQLETYYYDFIAEDGTTQFAEGDGILLYARHLLLVEVKSGRTSNRAPSGAVGTYLKRVSTLITEPVEQAERFLNELERTGSIVLRDKHRKPLITLSMTDFDFKYLITTTLEHLGEFTANVEGSAIMKVAQKNLPVFSVQLDDLRVIRDLVDFPAQFFHFLDQRMKAAFIPEFAITDEMEHFALYLKYNQYNLLKNEAPGHLSHLNFFAIKDDIDAFYHRLWSGETYNPKPSQSLPGKYGEIIRKLSKSNDETDVKAVKYLLDFDNATRSEISRIIEQMLVSQRRDQRIKPLHTGGENPLTLFGFTIGLPRTDWTEVTCKQYSLAAMKARNDEARLMLRIFFDEKDETAKVIPLFLNKKDIDAVPKELLNAMVEGFRTTVARQMGQKQKTRANEICPCGSGIKYKRCHGKPNNQTHT